MDGAANGVGKTKQQKRKKNASSVGAKWKTRKNKKEKRHGLVFHVGVWNGVQWSVLQTTGLVCSVKEQESDGRKESREYHVHGVLGTKVFGKITLSAGVVVVVWRGWEWSGTYC